MVNCLFSSDFANEVISKNVNFEQHEYVTELKKKSLGKGVKYRNIFNSDIVPTVLPGSVQK